MQSTKINNTLLREPLPAVLAGFFAVVAVVLAAIGLYGVLSYSVARRTKEIGIRVALGARQLGVVRLVISDVMLVIAVGLGIGIGGGLALGGFVATLLFEVKTSDFWSLALPYRLRIVGRSYKLTASLESLAKSEDKVTNFGKRKIVIRFIPKTKHRRITVLCGKHKGADHEAFLAVGQILKRNVYAALVVGKFDDEASRVLAKLGIGLRMSMRASHCLKTET